MPIIFTQEVAPKIHFGLWKIEEKEPELRSKLVLSENDLSEINQFKFEGRRLEWLAARLMFHHLHPDEAFKKIEKDEFGKPFIANSNWKLSISHTKGFAAALLSQDGKNVGMDIEKISKKIYKIKNKFLSEKEMDLLNPADEKYLEKLTAIWSAKEAVYKFYGRKKLDFKINMNLLSLANYNSGFFKLKLSTQNINQEITIYHQKRNDLMITWCFSVISDK